MKKPLLIRGLWYSCFFEEYEGFSVFASSGLASLGIYKRVIMRLRRIFFILEMGFTARTDQAFGSLVLYRWKFDDLSVGIIFW